MARATDGAGNMYLTVKELQKQEEQRRAGGGACLICTSCWGWRHMKDGSQSLLCLGMRGQKREPCMPEARLLPCSAWQQGDCLRSPPSGAARR